MSCSKMFKKNLRECLRNSRKIQSKYTINTTIIYHACQSVRYFCVDVTWFFSFCSLPGKPNTKRNKWCVSSMSWVALRLVLQWCFCIYAKCTVSELICVYCLRAANTLRHTKYLIHWNRCNAIMRRFRPFFIRSSSGIFPLVFSILL